MTALILRGLSAQEHDTDKRLPICVYCGIFHSQNILVCICVRYNLVLFAVLIGLIF